MKACILAGMVLWVGWCAVAGAADRMGGHGARSYSRFSPPERASMRVAESWTHRDGWGDGVRRGPSERPGRGGACAVVRSEPLCGRPAGRWVLQDLGCGYYRRVWQPGGYVVYSSPGCLVVRAW